MDVSTMKTRAKLIRGWWKVLSFSPVRNSLEWQRRRSFPDTFVVSYLHQTSNPTPLVPTWLEACDSVLRSSLLSLPLVSCCQRMPRRTKTHDAIPLPSSRTNRYACTIMQVPMLVVCSPSCTTTSQSTEYRAHSITATQSVRSTPSQSSVLRTPCPVSTLDSVVR